jgi:RNA 2',3'-cyclic 3'-phosphodiesterase
MARLRTFIAVDVGPEVRGRCVALQEKLARDAGGVKWVEPENLHVTLLFLGEVVDREVPALCRAVAQVAGRHEGFGVAVEGVGCFPNPRRPRVVWAGVGTGAAELVALHDALEPPLLELGCYRREERQYTPHLTLGRLKRDPDPEPFAAAIARQARWRGGEAAVTELLVLSSELTPKGPEYTVLGRGKLRKPGRRPREIAGEEE